jgi:hypothetical protein
MAPPEIPEEVLDFLSRHIESVPELEALLILSEQTQQPWNEPALAARVYVSLAGARLILEGLQRRKLVSQSPEGFRFAPADEAQRALVARVAHTYRTNLVAVANFIHRKAPGSVMEFARAFDLKKDH